jgi:hypothetical protein
MINLSASSDRPQRNAMAREQSSPNRHSARTNIAIPGMRRGVGESGKELFGGGGGWGVGADLPCCWAFKPGSESMFNPERMLVAEVSALYETRGAWNHSTWQLPQPTDSSGIRLGALLSYTWIRKV